MGFFASVAVFASPLCLPDGKAFWPCMTQTVWIRGSQNTCKGVKVFLDSSTTLSMSSLCQVVTRSPLLQFSVWSMDIFAPHPPQQEGSYIGSAPYNIISDSLHYCAPSSVPLKLGGWMEIQVITFFFWYQIRVSPVCGVCILSPLFRQTPLFKIKYIQ